MPALFFTTHVAIRKHTQAELTIHPEVYLAEPELARVLYILHVEPCLDACH